MFGNTTARWVVANATSGGKVANIEEFTEPSIGT